MGSDKPLPQTTLAQTTTLVWYGQSYRLQLQAFLTGAQALQSIEEQGATKAEVLPMAKHLMTIYDRLFADYQAAQLYVFRTTQTSPGFAAFVEQLQAQKQWPLPNLPPFPDSLRAQIEEQPPDAG